MFNFTKSNLEFVDLGLPSGTLWAKCNYGATTEDEYGKYYTFDEAKKLPINMPTKKQFEELISYTTSKWVEDYNGTSVNGRLFTSKKNGKSIFIPASGYVYNSSVNDRGSGGYVWASRPNARDLDYACSLYFGSSSLGVDNGYRYNGRSVRSVISK